MTTTEAAGDVFFAFTPDHSGVGVPLGPAPARFGVAQAAEPTEPTASVANSAASAASSSQPVESAPAAAPGPPPPATATDAASSAQQTIAEPATAEPATTELTAAEPATAEASTVQAAASSDSASAPQNPLQNQLRSILQAFRSTVATPAASSKSPPAAKRGRDSSDRATRPKRPKPAPASTAPPGSDRSSSDLSGAAAASAGDKPTTDAAAPGAGSTRAPGAGDDGELSDASTAADSESDVEMADAPVANRGAPGSSIAGCACAICRDTAPKPYPNTWKESAALALQVMSEYYRRQFFEIRKEIFPFIEDHWDKFVFRPKYHNWEQTIKMVLSKYDHLFVSGMKKFGSAGMWGLKNSPFKDPQEGDGVDRSKLPPPPQPKPKPATPKTPRYYTVVVTPDEEGEGGDVGGDAETPRPAKRIDAAVTGKRVPVLNRRFHSDDTLLYDNARPRTPRQSPAALASPTAEAAAAVAAIGSPTPADAASPAVGAEPTTPLSFQCVCGMEFKSTQGRSAHMRYCQTYQEKKISGEIVVRSASRSSKKRKSESRQPETGMEPGEVKSQEPTPKAKPKPTFVPSLLGSALREPKKGVAAAAQRALRQAWQHVWSQERLKRLAAAPEGVKASKKKSNNNKKKASAKAGGPQSAASRRRSNLPAGVASLKLERAEGGSVACPMCPKTFSTEGYARRHINTAHLLEHSQLLGANAGGSGGAGDSAASRTMTRSAVLKQEKRAAKAAYYKMISSQPQSAEPVPPVVIRDSFCANEYCRSGIPPSCDGPDGPASLCTDCASRLKKNPNDWKLSTERKRELGILPMPKEKSARSSAAQDGEGGAEFAKERSVPCETCGKRFTDVRYLTRHNNRFHTGAKQEKLEFPSRLSGEGGEDEQRQSRRVRTKRSMIADHLMRDVAGHVWDSSDQLTPDGLPQDYVAAVEKLRLLMGENHVLRDRLDMQHSEINEYRRQLGLPPLDVPPIAAPPPAPVAQIAAPAAAAAAAPGSDDTTAAAAATTAAASPPSVAVVPSAPTTATASEPAAVDAVATAPQAAPAGAPIAALLAAPIAGGAAPLLALPPMHDSRQPPSDIATNVSQLPQVAVPAARLLAADGVASHTFG